jgi:hypothetical protein
MRQGVHVADQRCESAALSSLTAPVIHFPTLPQTLLRSRPLALSHRSMAASTIPAGGFTLHSPSPDMDASKHNYKSAILFKLSQSMLNDLLEASNTKEGLQFVTGKAPVSLSPS